MLFLGLPVTAIWIAFAVLLIFTPSTLTDIQNWIAGLHIVLEVIVWIVFLPWVGSLWIWESDLALWLRIVLIVVIAIVTIGLFNQRSARKRSQR